MSTPPGACGLILRETGSAELRAMAAVMDDAFDPAFGEAWTPAQCQGILDLPGVWLTIAELGGAAVGFALGRIILDEAELLLLAVRPQQRRGGIGTALLARTFAMARQRGARRVHLEVRDGNGAAILYKRAGFVNVGRRRAYYRGKDGQLFDAISLTLPLDYQY
jgi:[ribosomal protein S18]-alanine N-acetyltransferase